MSPKPPTGEFDYVIVGGGAARDGTLVAPGAA